jgi:membrane fusion protein
MNGRVTALQVRTGETADPGRPLLNISPPGAELVAELYLPSRAIAFIAPRQEVKIQYDAFPYQKFGVAKLDDIRGNR